MRGVFFIVDITRAGYILPEFSPLPFLGKAYAMTPYLIAGGLVLLATLIALMTLRRHHWKQKVAKQIKAAHLQGYAKDYISQKYIPQAGKAVCRENLSRKLALIGNMRTLHTSLSATMGMTVPEHYLHSLEDGIAQTSATTLKQATDSVAALQQLLAELNKLPLTDYRPDIRCQDPATTAKAWMKRLFDKMDPSYTEAQSALYDYLGKCEEYLEQNLGQLNLSYHRETLASETAAWTGINMSAFDRALYMDAQTYSKLHYPVQHQLDLIKGLHDKAKAFTPGMRLTADEQENARYLLQEWAHIVEQLATNAPQTGALLAGLGAPFKLSVTVKA